MQRNEKTHTFLWSDIKYVLFDLDGTLLDSHFDDTFWLEYLPMTLSVKKGISCKL